MQNIIWEVEILKPPSAVRYCKKCGTRTEYDNSGFFRINAQRKSLDIWLIYKCRNCDTTWNSTLMTRTAPQNLDRELLERFHGNDPELVRQYAMDTELLKRNGSGVTVPEYRITGPAPDFTQEGRLQIRCKYPFSLKISAIMREKLGLSHSGFAKLLENGVIRIHSGDEIGFDLKKSRLQKEMQLSWSPPPGKYGGEDG